MPPRIDPLGIRSSEGHIATQPQKRRRHSHIERCQLLATLVASAFPCLSALEFLARRIKLDEAVVFCRQTMKGCSADQIERRIRVPSGHFIVDPRQRLTTMSVEGVDVLPDDGRN